MNKKNLSFLAIIFSAVLITSCDDTPGSDLGLDDPRVISISLTPSNIDFLPSDGIKDTLVTIQVRAMVENLEENVLPRLAVFSRDEDSSPVLTADLSSTSNTNEYEAIFELPLNTLDFLVFDVFVFSFGDFGDGNWVSSTLSVDGFANNKPVILEASNIEEVTIPTDGSSIPVQFTAKVTDEDGQNTINRVSIIFLNEDGSTLTPNPNELFDDGQAASGDLVAGDSLYTITFSINGSNTPNNRTALYFAIDNAGLSSDTVRTTFNIVRN